MTSATTIILRFRDLATLPGDTVKLHNDICRTDGYVWWGWWHKSGETVPETQFRALMTLIGQGTLKVFLLDSGRNLLLQATCHEIKWNYRAEAEASPEPLKTPDYYRDRPCKAWFKFGLLEEVDPSEIRHYSYMQADDVFENRRSQYGDFYDKQVFDLDELRQQDRTIWFIRTRTASDKVHRVSLLDRMRTVPADFSEDLQISKFSSLLWLSDLHFSSEEHAFAPKKEAVRKDLATAIKAALVKHEIPPLAGVLVSGDITWQADPSEFSLALDFLKEIGREPTALPSNYRYVICPGNHDLKFTIDPGRKGVALADDVHSSVARESYVDFYQSLFYKAPNKFLSSGRKFLLGGALPVEIAALNSSYLEQTKGWFQGHGFIGSEQLSHAAEEMGWSQSSGARAFRILMIHHHVIPVAYQLTPAGGYQYSTVLDAGALMSWICENRIDLVLHGHMHEDFHAQITRPIRENGGEEHTFFVAGLGSSGVAKEHRGECQNMFGVLNFRANHVGVSMYTVSDTLPSRELWTIKIPRVQKDVAEG